MRWVVTLLVFLSSATASAQVIERNTARQFWVRVDDRVLRNEQAYLALGDDRHAALYAERKSTRKNVAAFGAVLFVVGGPGSVASIANGAFDRGGGNGVRTVGAVSLMALATGVGLVLWGVLSSPHPVTVRGRARLGN